MITTIENGIVWEKDRHGCYWSSWPNRGLRIVQGEVKDHEKLWSLMVFHPFHSDYKPVHSDRRIDRVMWFAEIFMARH